MRPVDYRDALAGTAFDPLRRGHTPSLPGPGLANDATRKKQIPFRSGLAEYRKDGFAPPAKILDMGAGSGVIGLSLALAFPESRVTMTDISPEALTLARENAEIAGVPAARLTFVQSDLFTALAEQRFDLIAANLPYIPAAEIPALSPEVRRDPVLALDGGARGTELIERFLAAVPQHLAPGGLVALEAGAGQTESLADIMRGFSLSEVAATNDHSRRDRFLMGRAR